MFIPTSHIVAIQLNGEWITVKRRSFTLTEVYLENDVGPSTAMPMVTLHGFQFENSPNEWIAGRLEDIKGYKFDNGKGRPVTG